jgi:low molecular weight protein-tyrosine phosphatase
MQALVADAGLEQEILVESAGTGGWHVGERADPRARGAAARRGIELASVARQVSEEDFERFDLILAMDASNQHALRQLAPDEADRAKVRLLREFDPASEGSQDLDVPDPYYDSERGFEIVLDMVQAACAGLLEQLRSREPA